MPRLARITGFALLLAFTLAACSHKGASSSELKPKAGLQFRVASYAEYPGWRRDVSPGQRMPAYVGPTIIVGSRDIQSLRYLGCTKYGCQIQVTLTPNGGQTMMQFTATHIGKQIALLLDDRLQTIATINAPFGSTFQIGETDEKDARALLKRLTR